MFQLMPVIILVKRSWEREMPENEILNAFAHKVISLCNHDTFRICYLMIDLLRFTSKEEVKSFAVRSMGYLIKVIDLVRRVSC